MMDPMIVDYLEGIELGEMQGFQNMGVVPLLAPSEGGPSYLTLKGALEEGLLSVTEVSQGGSVPELKVTNNAESSVLLLDGEELAGAKQNRVLNTTILLKKKSDTVIPVSCTEHGRWSYASAQFSDSGVVMPPAVRMRKARSVAASLERSREYRSDQTEVWDQVAELSARAAAPSPTGAMRDVFSAREHDLDDYLKAFECIEHQRGLLVIIGSAVVAFDVLSRESAYKQLHPKLVKSYAMDALLDAPKGADKLSPDTARVFIKEACGCEEKKHSSVGLGWDCRFQGPNMVGSALTYRKTVIHAAFFRADESDKVGRVSSFRRRRDARIF